MTFTQILGSQPFTELELRTLIALCDLLTPFFGEAYSDVDCTDIAKRTGLDVNTIKGVVGSLVRKGVVGTDQISTDTIHNLVYFVDQEQMTSR